MKTIQKIKWVHHIFKNGDFFLTDEQRRKVYEEYKRSRGLKENL